MKQDQRVAQHQEASDSPSVLLAGFPTEEAQSIASTLNKMGWRSTILIKEAEIKASFAAQRFDVTVIDAKHIEVFAPHFITYLRGIKGPSTDATILAVDNFTFTSFKDQLLRSGADLVVPKPSDPKMYIVNFTRAATYRLQSIGTARLNSTKTTPA